LRFHEAFGAVESMHHEGAGQGARVFENPYFTIIEQPHIGFAPVAGIGRSVKIGPFGQQEIAHPHERPSGKIIPDIVLHPFEGKLGKILVFREYRYETPKP
jgi:hypothetical protein